MAPFPPSEGLGEEEEEEEEEAPPILRV